MIICHLHRVKLDANRDITEAALGNPIAEKVIHQSFFFNLTHDCFLAKKKKKKIRIK